MRRNPRLLGKCGSTRGDGSGILMDVHSFLQEEPVRDSHNWFLPSESSAQRVEG